LVVVWLILGLIILSCGAEVLVRGASALALAARISPLVVGLTVVAFGTSSPELVISLQSVLRGQPEIGLGNVIGSNIFNVLFVLGVSAMIVPLAVSRKLVRFDVPLMFGLSVLTLLFALDGTIGRLDGGLLVIGLIAYLYWAITSSRQEEQARAEAEAEALGQAAATSSVTRILVQFVKVGIGLAMLIVGSRWFSDAAVEVARRLGVSELVIGLTIVAIGTSLPEVATSILAAIRGERDIAVGNIVGSNLFNIMAVLGITGLVAPGGIPVPDEAVQFDLPVMTAVALACLPIYFTGHRIDRWEGWLFFGYFCAYTVHLFLSAKGWAVHRTFGTIMLGFVVPLTAVTLIVTVMHAVRNRRRPAR
jgi:cation:H+ antiporter